ncbi:hypothetical protein HW130_22665 [Streptomyces sp. PKU-EA00015]|uniref:hypothetical protein n=1 Tax=Streptomyces sp. PKU-EA00015 TaxID=2748326 RepID=UPI0015A06FD0|nr:hypothetical protein [Streptomyces sp. PKU-EA00015]NWF29026.1 hypothetical protein [Streptomyces sp. PKU-EA00015]
MPLAEGAACPQAGAKGSFEPSSERQPLPADAEERALGPELRLYSFAVGVNR